MDFVLKYLTEHMPKSAGMIKLIAGDEKKVFDILSSGEVVKFHKGEKIFKYSDPVCQIFILLKGQCKYSGVLDSKVEINKDQIIDITEILEKEKTNEIKSECTCLSDNAIVLILSLEEYKQSVMQRDFLNTKKLLNKLEAIQPVYRTFDPLVKIQKLNKFTIVEKNIGDILYMPEDANLFY